MDAWWLTEHLVRKAAHFTEYAGLGFLLFAQIPDWLSILGYCIIIAMAVVMFFYNKESDK